MKRKKGGAGKTVARLSGFSVPFWLEMVHQIPLSSPLEKEEGRGILLLHPAANHYKIHVWGQA